MAKISLVVCKKCGEKYPRWRLERENVCEARISTKDGWKRCCGTIVVAEVETDEQSPSRPNDPGWPPPVTDGAVY